ncbi:MAG: dephospho-CoA kinase [Erysipelotrichaceae bacterium]|nr:dephospho-CoA kinase [Erysipelotrichaceae bacterium]
MKVIGITSSIAGGKSTVTSYLRQKGYVVLDADEISHHALDKGTRSYYQVKEMFMDCMDEDRNIDRKKLGKIVFNDERLKKQLEDIIHPYVSSTMKKQIQQSHEDVIFLDIPLLYEAHFEYLCDKIIVVYVDEKTQCERLMKRNHIDKDEALHLMQQQISIEEKKKKADYVLDNTLGFEDLYQNIERILTSEIVHE